MSSKLTQATWLQFFDEGDGNRSNYMVGAILAYWLSWFMMPNGLEDTLNPHMFRLAILVSKRVHSHCLTLPQLLVRSAIWMCEQRDSIYREVRCGHTRWLVLPLDVPLTSLQTNGVFGSDGRECFRKVRGGWDHLISTSLELGGDGLASRTGTNIWPRWRQIRCLLLHAVFLLLEDMKPQLLREMNKSDSSRGLLAKAQTLLAIIAFTLIHCKLESGENCWLKVFLVLIQTYCLFCVINHLNSWTKLAQLYDWWCWRICGKAGLVKSALREDIV